MCSGFESTNRGLGPRLVLIRETTVVVADEQEEEVEEVEEEESPLACAMTPIVVRLGVRSVGVMIDAWEFRRNGEANQSE